MEAGGDRRGEAPGARGPVKHLQTEKEKALERARQLREKGKVVARTTPTEGPGEQARSWPVVSCLFTSFFGQDVSPLLRPHGYQLQYTPFASLSPGMYIKWHPGHSTAVFLEVNELRLVDGKKNSEFRSVPDVGRGRHAQSSAPCWPSSLCSLLAAHSGLPTFAVTLFAG